MGNYKLSNIRLKTNLTKLDGIKFIRRRDMATTTTDCLKLLNDMLSDSIELHIETYEVNTYEKVFDFDKVLVESASERSERVSKEVNSRLLYEAQEWYMSLSSIEQSHIRVLIKNTGYLPPTAASEVILRA